MQHTVVINTKNDEGNVKTEVKVLEDNRALDAFLKEIEIRRHPSPAMQGQCFVQDKYGDDILIFKGTPEVIQFSESFKVLR